MRHLLMLFGLAALLVQPVSADDWRDEARKARERFEKLERERWRDYEKRQEKLRKADREFREKERERAEEAWKQRRKAQERYEWERERQWSRYRDHSNRLGRYSSWQGYNSRRPIYSDDRYYDHRDDFDRRWYQFEDSRFYAPPRYYNFGYIY